MAKLDNVEFFLAQYFLELALLDSKMNQFLPSVQAATAVLLATQIQRNDIEWDRMEE